MNIELDSEQTELLRELLDGIARDLSYEIANTNNSRFKAGLRRRADAVADLLNLVGGPL